MNAKLLHDMVSYWNETTARALFRPSCAKMSPMFTLTTERSRMRVYLIVLAALIAIALIYKMTHVPTATSDIAAIRPFFLT